MNLEQQKKRAREFLRAIRAGNPDALAQLRAQHLRWAGVDDATVRQQLALHDAQFVIARQQGFASWTKLKAYAEASPCVRHARLFMIDPQWIIARVHGLLRTRQSAGPAALEQIREWHPSFHACSDEEIRQAPFSEADAQLVYARQHGFDTWQDFLRRVTLLSTAPNAEATEPFLAAFRTLESENIAGLKTLLAAHPPLARERGTNGNSLLNLAVSIAGRKHTDVGLPLVEALIAAGADVNESNDRGWTPLHQAAYSNQHAVAAALMNAGADLDTEAHGSGGTPLIAALFWGHREVADLLGAHSVAPGNLRVAAGLGDRKLLDNCFVGSSKLTPEACAARGFYRPHSGFPDWQPSPDPQQVLDEALVWACKSGRTDVLARLVLAGARLEADPYRGTPLIWAAACNRLATVEWLIDHGANINQQATFGGLRHGQGVAALHLAAQNGHLAIVRLLIQRGADPQLKDHLYASDALGWATHSGQFAVRDYLRSL